MKVNTLGSGMVKKNLASAREVMLVKDETHKIRNIAIKKKGGGKENLDEIIFFIRYV